MEDRAGEIRCGRALRENPAADLNVTASGEIEPDVRLEVLFRDPKDGRYGELTDPHGEWQGGGPPCLTVISRGDAVWNYGDMDR